MPTQQDTEQRGDQYLKLTQYLVIIELGGNAPGHLSKAGSLESSRQGSENSLCNLAASSDRSVICDSPSTRVTAVHVNYSDAEFVGVGGQGLENRVSHPHCFCEGYPWDI